MGENMKKNIISAFIIFATQFLLAGCGSSATTTSTTADFSNAGAMVAAAFSSATSSSMNQAALPMQLLNFIVANAQAQEGDTNTCDESNNTPSNVTTTLTGEAGTYGSADDAITITNAETAFCENTEGTINENPDDLLFASFTVSEATVSCDDDFEATMSGEGIWRNRDDLGFFPQIYGTFTITIEGSSGIANCSISLNADSTVADASCSDTSGNAITLSEDISCTIDAGENAVPSDPAGENG